ncbi:DC1 domain-containing protein [Aspergillus luchuensis]|uniref:ZZ-type domain-containing protein n=1 Tax=Aspergillus kawachii TaxID=1069201 RepID=A0A7R7WJH0_ASPKA|nr:uncharacterized protein AKAW2_71035A [Aspergillus luchuensis]BCS04157.1 hypothetical protein AKAW2_71035A [Aspergillus luchuensis]
MEGRRARYFHVILAILSQCSGKISSLPESILRLDGYQGEVACDVCQVYVDGDGVYYRCSRCNDYRFAICDDCKTRGMVHLSEWGRMKCVNWNRSNLTRSDELGLMICIVLAADGSGLGEIY